MNGHPSFDILDSESNLLHGKVIVMGLTGSVACVRAPDIARKLMRAGAQVYSVMTQAACRLIHPDLMEWATGHKPITELTGAIEHVDLVGNVPVHADLLLIAPATANTVSKIACGIDDSPVTTFVTTGFGEGIPLLIVPAMHLSMYNHPIVRDNITRLEGYGAHFLMPRLEEGKAKIPSEADILDAVVGLVGPRPWAGKRVVITAGRTVEFLDPIRVITNNSTGKMGTALARAARALGAEVVLVYGKGTAPVPAGVRHVAVDTADAMLQAVQTELKTTTDVFIAAAAVGDWKPAERSAHKITTHGADKLVLELVPTPKILDQVRDLSPQTYLVAFRAQSGLTDAELAADAQQRLAKARADLIAVNDEARPGQGFEKDTNALAVFAADGGQTQIPLASKDQVARDLMALIAQRLTAATKG